MKARLENNHVFVGMRDCGYIDLDRGVYVSERTHLHQFVKYEGGFGISCSILDLLDNLKIEWVVINYENIKGYITNTSKFLTKGIEFDFNGDLQLILPLSEWELKMNEERPEFQTTIQSI